MFINTWTGPSSGNLRRSEFILPCLNAPVQEVQAGRLIQFDLFARKIVSVSVNLRVWLEER